MSTPLARRMTSSPLHLMLACLVAFAAAFTPASAWASDHPSTAALDAMRGKEASKNVIQNRFFLKQNRFEIAPAGGYVPNNAFVSVAVGGAFLAYHFNEAVAVEGLLLYAPNTGDAGVKNLTRTLVAIAYEGDDDSKFQQPLDRLQLGAIFSARWAPVYGKINLIGEGVLNFDVYGTAGIGLLLITKDYAKINPEYANGTSEEPVLLESGSKPDANIAVNLGIGFDFFLSQSLALKLDARSQLYVAEEPDYGNLKGGEPEDLGNRLYNTFITSVGVAIFIPKMKPRIYNF